MDNTNGKFICRDCIYRDFITNRGLVCKRTGNAPDTKSECADFKYDEEIAKIAPPPVIDPDDPAQLNEEVLLKEENMPMAILFGLVAAIVGAILWAVVSVSTGRQMGLMAIGMGFIVGHAVRRGGKGIRPLFGIVGALLALLGCMMGDYFSIIGFVAETEGMNYMQTLLNVNFFDVVPVLIRNLMSMTILFYAFALFEGYKLSFRMQVTAGGKI